jgi:hypothetical protein
MITTDLCVKETFTQLSFASADAKDTQAYGARLAKLIARTTPFHGCTLSIVGALDSGKTTLVEGIVNHFASASQAYESIQKGRGVPIWRTWSNPEDKIMIRSMDEVGFNIFLYNVEGPHSIVPPSLQQTTIDIFEHATKKQQERSLAVVEIYTDRDDVRMLDVYLNPKHISKTQLRNQWS